MTAEMSTRSKASSWGLLNNFRYLNKKAMMLHTVENTKSLKKHQQKFTSMKRKRTGKHSEIQATNKVVKKTKWRDTRQAGGSPQNCEDKTADTCETVRQPCVSQSFASVRHKAEDRHSLAAVMTESWEVDSGYSEASPPVSGRSSPCLRLCSTTVVALDCEMVGTGPGGRCNELARCSILDYHGNVLYDKYVRPCQPVTDYRTRWSGIQRHHLRNATPFAQAREEILGILEGKVVVGHAIYNDFGVLDMLHPGHMVRDTSATHFLSRLARIPGGHLPSLKILAIKLLNRRIQVGRRGHCSVEDAQAALDLYKLVEGEWEQEFQMKLRGDEPTFASSNHYMQDEYWPDDIIADSQ